LHSLVRPLLGFGLLIALYALLCLEVLHRTVAALLVASIALLIDVFYRYASFDRILASIDLNTILLLICMMMFVGVLSRTGAFEYIAMKISRRFGSRPYALVSVVASITAAISAFIDNVTTVLLLLPIVLEIVERARMDPRPIAFATVFASNIGGTATLIGDPPNIIIGSEAHLGFDSFIYNLAPATALCMVFTLVLLKGLYREWFSEYSKTLERLKALGIELVSERAIEVDHYVVKRALAVLLLVVAMFILEDFLKYPPAVPPLVGVGLLLTLVRSRISVEEALRSVDLATIMFFVAMFVVVGATDSLGVPSFIAKGIAFLAHSFVTQMLAILWISALASAFIDNIPLVASMIPVIKALAHGHCAEPLFWALSLGGCMGGNGTLVGASANVVAAGILEKRGYHVSFAEFTRYGMMVLITTMTICSLYLVLRYGLG